MLFRTLLAASALSLTVGLAPTYADDVMAHLRAVAQACAGDIQNFCQGMAPGGGRIIRCLGSNYLSVSPACRGMMASAMNEVCGQDLARLCPGSTLGSGQAESCLQAHVADLKGSCKAAADRLAAK